MGCTETTRPLVDDAALRPALNSSAGTSSDDTNLGIGGKYTLNVSGPYVTYRDPSPSGITLFPGIPVEVIVTGQITREMTAGFINHCTLLPFACPPFLASNAPFGPGGLEDTNLGAATSWWDYFFGAYYYTSPGGSVAYRGLSGTNLLLGRTGLYCTWGHVYPDGTVEQGDCYDMGGGFTYSVHAQKPPLGQAGLTLAITKNGLGPSGGPVDLSAATTDGSEAENLTWYFVADAVTEETDPPVPAASLSLSPRTTSASHSRAANNAGASSASRFPAPGQRVRAINAHTGETTLTTDVRALPAGDYLFLSADSSGTALPALIADAGFAKPTASGSTAAVQAGSAASARQLLPSRQSASLGSPLPYGGTLPEPIVTSAALDGCDGSLTCSANLHVAGGTFVVTGIVHGVLRAAERRVTALPEDPERPRLHVVVASSTDELLEPEVHVAAGNCGAQDTQRPRRLHVFVIDSGKTVPQKLANTLVNLDLTAVVPADPTEPDAGGHVVARHTGNPKPPGRLSQAQVVTDVNGDAYVTYRASEFGGKYEVRGTSEGAVPGADTITVGVSLAALSGGAHYSFIGRTDEHPINHFGSPMMNQRLGALASTLSGELNVDLEFNDLSLPLGGRFEVADRSHPQVAWDNPAHCDHRWGKGADVRTRTFQTGYTRENPSPTVQEMIRVWNHMNTDWPRKKLPSGKTSVPYFWEGDHLHLKTVR